MDDAIREESSRDHADLRKELVSQAANIASEETRNKNSETSDMTGSTEQSEARASEKATTTSRLPSRRRTAPSKLKDYYYADVAVKEEPPDKCPSPELSRRPLVRRRGRPRKLAPRDHTYQLQEGEMEGGEKTGSGVETGEVQWLKYDRGLEGEDNEPAARRSRTDPFDEGMLTRPRSHRCLMTGCGQTFLHLSTLLKHTATMHSDSDEPRVGRPALKTDDTNAPLRPYKCTTCNKSFSQKGNLRSHMMLHTGEKPYHCDEADCTQSFRSGESLKNHKRKHLGIKLYQCQVCEVQCTTNQALKEHTMRHTDTKPHVCPTCNQAFRQISCYTRHLTTHTNDKPYSCDVCGKRFARLAYVRSHYKTHTGEKSYACRECGKRFAHQSDRNRHEVIHTDKKPFGCDICGVHFNDASSCRRHKYEHANYTASVCEQCGESFRKASQLRSHIKREHSAKTQEFAMETNDKDIVLQQMGDQLILSSNNEVDIHQNIVEEIGRTLSGIQGPVAYHILHEDDKQQVVEIHYSAPEESHGNLVESHDNLVVSQENMVQSQENVGESQDNMVESQGRLVVSQENMVESQENLVESQENQDFVSEHQTDSYENPVEAQENHVVTHEISENPSHINQDEVQDTIEPAMENSQSNVTFVQSNELAANWDTSKQSEHKASYTQLLSTDLCIQAAQDGTVVREDGTIALQDGTVLIEIHPDQSQSSTIVSKLSGDTINAQQLILEDGQIVAVDEEGEQHINNATDSQNESDVATDCVSSQNCTPTENLQSDAIGESNDDIGYSTENFNKSESILSDPSERLTLLQAQTETDFIRNPDFNSQLYYDWLSSFCQIAQQLTIPIELDLFLKVSQVHKSLMDVMASPRGVLLDKQNFRTLMEMSTDLNSVISSHVSHVLNSLDK